MKYIKIDKEAVYELLREHFISEQQNLFNNRNSDDTIQSFYLDEDMNFTCLLQDENKDKPCVDCDDLEKLSRGLSVTTDSLYTNKKLYKNLSKKDIQDILK